MATPLTVDGGGGVAVLSNSVNKVDSSSSRSTNGFLKSSEEEPRSPILIFLFFHKAIRKELDALHRLAMAFATGKQADIRPLLERYHLLRSIYKHHSNAEDEVLILFFLFPYSGFIFFEILKFRWSFSVCSGKWIYSRISCDIWIIRTWCCYTIVCIWLLNLQCWWRFCCNCVLG